MEVKVVDHVWSDWKVTKSSHELHQEGRAHHRVPGQGPGGRRDEGTYTIRTKW